MIDTNKRVVHRWFEEVWNQGREETIDELFSAHGVAYGLGEAGVEVRGPEQFKPFWRNLRDAFPDLRISIEDTIAENDRVVVRVILEGHSPGLLHRYSAIRAARARLGDSDCPASRR